MGGGHSSLDFKQKPLLVLSDLRTFGKLSRVQKWGRGVQKTFAEA